MKCHKIAKMLLSLIHVTDRLATLDKGSEEYQILTEERNRIFGIIVQLGTDK